MILVLIALLVLIYVLGNLGCAYEDTVLDNKNIGRAHINENVKPIFNKGHLSIGDFLIEAGKEINHMQSYHGWQIYRVRVEVMRNLFRDYEIHTIWVYYD